MQNACQANLQEEKITGGGKNGLTPSNLILISPPRSRQRKSALTDTTFMWNRVKTCATGRGATGSANRRRSR